MSDMTTKMSPPERESDFGRPFWDAARTGRLCLQSGRGGHALQHPPRPLSLLDGSRDIEWVEVSGRGTVYSFTINHRAAPGFENQTPYVTAIIDLVEGVRITANVTGDINTLKIGSSVLFRGDLNQAGAPMFHLDVGETQ